MNQPFVLDRFQEEAIAAIDAGVNVLVAAPTGAGKTVVAEHAVDTAIRDRRRAFYTTPIKALSNQKYQDLVASHGADRVGLLTGDNSINADAPVVVMTTEVLRNMIYAGSDALHELSWVVLDEIHFLQDTYRGPVWEEVLIHAPPAVRFACLSATVSNADELAAWIEAARGPTETVIETERPVELSNHFLVKDRTAAELITIDTLVGGRPNPRGQRFDTAGGDTPRHLRHRTRRRWATPSRGEVVDHLRSRDLLPAIVFVFSRKGCDDAVRRLMAEGQRLTSRAERTEIARIAEAHVRHLADRDLAILGYERFVAALEAGIAAHHAGMVPPFKEAVEACFVRGLVKIVFATETLALGINMPARSVVIEALSKFTGDHHEDLTPAQYTQLTGRAGRRGLDPVGHAIVLWSPWNTFDKVAALAASRDYVLRSVFRPTPNMAVNLVDRYDRAEAHELIGRSFAQFQADRNLGKLAHRRARLGRRLDEADEAATCDLGDVEEYRRRRREERRARHRIEQDREELIEAAMARLAPGDVFRFGRGRWAVLSVAHRRGSVRIRAVDPHGHVSNFDPVDFDELPTSLATLPLPEPFDPRNRIIERRLAAALRKAEVSDRASTPVDDELIAPDLLRAEDHPVAACPDLARHLEGAAERDRLRRRVAEMDRRMTERSGSLARRLDELITLLERRGFVEDWTLTDQGRILSRIFHENDVTIATVLGERILDGLEPNELAGLVSMFVYEHRSKEPAPPSWFPNEELRVRAERVEVIADDVFHDGSTSGLLIGGRVDTGFVGIAHRWASGRSLERTIDDADISPGDFVRTVKTLIDLLRQIEVVAPLSSTRRSAASAADRLLRGVVAASAEVSTGERPE